MARVEQAVDIALAWLTLALVYRLTLQTRVGSAFLWADAWEDVAVALLLTLLALLLSLVARRLALAVSALLLVLVGLEAQVFAHVMAAMRIALDWPTLRDALQSDDWKVVQTGDARDWLAVLTPVVLLGVLRTLPHGRARLRPGLAVVLAAMLALGVTWATPRPDDWPDDAARNPLVALTWPAQMGEEETFETKQMTKPSAVADPLPVPAETTPATAVALPEPATQPYNVVWIIMESTGTRYFNGEFRDAPMPTLRRLADEGWYLSHHQSPSNSSATSIFAQLSGLYPNPQTAMFATQADNWIPALPAFLPAAYERFLYTPGRLNFFFPQAFLRHSGLTDLVGFDETTVTRNVGIEHMSKDEIATVTTFLERLQRAHEPFLGIYYSFSPHWPYTDYGAKWHKFPGSQPIDKYHNALWLLDQQIARIVEQLRADGRLDRTILVLVGDHGEAFGQHEHNWAHARGSFQENFETPAILWQPRVFAPRVVAERTSHIDLLPTLLDALHVAFKDAQFQGQSLWRAHSPRPQVFAWSNEGMATVTTAAGVKVSWGVQDGRCRVFELASDPQERRPLACKEHAQLLGTLKGWVTEQRAELKGWNETARAAGK